MSMEKWQESEDKLEVPEGKWSLKHLVKFLRLYGAHRCLWDFRDSDNQHRKLRKAALIDIGTAMNCMTINQVVRKINVLRATYRYEKRRIKQRMRKGMPPKTKLKWFALADSFLRHIPRSGKSLKKMTCDSDSELDDNIVFEIDAELLGPLKEQVSKVETQDEHNLPNTLVVAENNKTKLMDEWIENVEFVNLLSSHNCLLQYCAENDEHNAALQLMSQKMEQSIEQICQQVHKFKRICNAEKMKIQMSAAYEPPYKWWPLAKQLMDDMEQQTFKVAVVDNFIDVNELPPLTASSNQAHNIVETSEKNLVNGLEDNLLDGKWSLKYSVKFLRLYGAHRCLWDLNDGDYRSREMRSAAIEDIASAMGHGLSADFVAKKIKIFRITYMQHRKRMIEAHKQGKQPNIQLLWFPLADSFLRKHIGLRSIGPAEPEIPQFEYQDVVTNLNLIDPALLTEFHGKGTQNTIEPALWKK